MDRKVDVSALYAALVSGILRSLATQHLSPAALLSSLNDQLQERKLASQYVTMLMAVWDDSNQTLQIANAGSVQPLFVTADTTSLTNAIDVRTIKVEGFPLGLFPNVTYEETTLTTQPGDLIVFFSDGIVDANDPKGQMFGSERLCTLLQHHPTATTSAEMAVEAMVWVGDDSGCVECCDLECGGPGAGESARPGADAGASSAEEDAGGCEAGG